MTFFDCFSNAASPTRAKFAYSTLTYTQIAINFRTYSLPYIYLHTYICGGEEDGGGGRFGRKLVRPQKVLAKLNERRAENKYRSPRVPLELHLGTAG